MKISELQLESPLPVAQDWPKLLLVVWDWGFIETVTSALISIGIQLHLHAIHCNNVFTSEKWFVMGISESGYQLAI